MSVERFRIEHGAIPSAVREVCATIHRAGFGAWIVGGCVRDLLLGRSVADWDVCSSAKPEQVKKLFRKVIPTGIQHGTVTVVLDGVHYEVTTLRGEGAYSDGRRPDSVFYVDDVREDLARRDFTVNAIAYDVTRDEFIDPFGGREDLIAKVIRAVGDGAERFREDGLRVLRAARFSATLGFELDAATRDAIAPNLPTFKKVSRERVRDEWLKTMKAARPSRAFEIMLDTGILEVVCPELVSASRIVVPEFNLSLFSLGMAMMDAIAPGDAVLRLAALLHGLDLTAIDRFATTNKCSTAERARLVHLASCVRSWPASVAPTDLELRRWLRMARRECVSEIAALLRARADVLGDSAARDRVEHSLARVDEMVVRRDPIDAKELAVNGGDLQSELGIPPSKKLGELISWALDRVVEDPALNERATLLAMLRARVAEGGDDAAR